MSADATLELSRLDFETTVQLPAETLVSLGGPCTRESLKAGIELAPDYKYVVAGIRAKVASTPLSSAASQYLERNLGTSEVHTVTDQELHNFHGCHLNNLRARGLSPEQSAEVESEKLRHIQAITRAKWVSKHASATAVQVERAEVLIGNVWDFWLNDGGHAYHDLGQNYVVVSLPKDSKDAKDIRRPLGHEFAHVQFDTDRLGAFPHWFVEGMATHVEYGLKNGHPEIIDPYERRRLYPDETDHIEFRAFLATIYEQRSGLWCLATQAYTSPLGTSEWAAFHNSLDQAWGRGALDNLNSDIRRRQADYARKFGTTHNQYRYAISAVADATDHLEGYRHMPAGRHARIKK
jgi:hypothetical protein